MRFSPITRQVVFFALAVLVPAAMMVAVGVALMQKETELAVRRAEDGRTLVARQVGDSLFTDLERAYTRVSSPTEIERYTSTQPALLVLGRHEAGVFRPRTDAVGSPTSRGFARFMSETESTEASKGPGASLPTYRARLRRSVDGVSGQPRSATPRSPTAG